MKLGKSLVLYPLGPYKSVTIRADDCNDWKEVNTALRTEYLRLRDMLSEADQNRYDKLLK